MGAGAALTELRRQIPLGSFDHFEDELRCVGRREEEVGHLVHAFEITQNLLIDGVSESRSPKFG